jgi:protein SCO1/2
MLNASVGMAQAPLPADTEIRQNIGARLPADLLLHDEAGRQLRLGALFGPHPAILAIVYYRCPNLCGIVLANLAAALDMAALTPGRDVEVIAVSMDPREGSADAAARKEALLSDASDAAAAGWHLLTGEAAGVGALANAVGLPFRYDPTNDQYVHATGVALITPAGIVAGYLPGLDYPPDALRRGIAGAESGTLSEPVARVRLACFSGVTARGLQGTLVRALLPGTAAFGLAALAGTILLARRRGRGG